NFKSGVGGFTLRLSHEPSAAEVISELKEAIGRKAWREIVFCGFGEPTASLDCLVEVARWIRRNYAKPVVIRVNTNGHGYVLNAGRDVVAELKAAGVDKVSVSLNAHDEAVYSEVCKPAFAGAYDAVLKFIERAKAELDVEVTAVTTPEVDLREVEALAKRLGVKFRLRVCVPCFW
ncbi:MAG: TatD family nuclease-associated radical SAM protein, partial [Candidatus Bathyarchaeota archaeon]|nr:TatD family nuclease-associated radical SAM protein [Candidatus Bathyarchaeota archaeon]